MSKRASAISVPCREPLYKENWRPSVLDPATKQRLIDRRKDIHVPMLSLQSNDLYKRRFERRTASVSSETTPSPGSLESQGQPLRVPFLSEDKESQ